MLFAVATIASVGLVACEDGGTAAAPAVDAGTKKDPPSRPITDPAPPPAGEEAARPTATKIEPASVAAGSVGPTVVVTGTGFTPRSVVLVGGEALETSFESDTQISATLATAQVGTVGVLKLSVKTPAPGGGESEALDFAVENPPPTLIQITPLSIVAGSGDTTVTAVGSTFVKTSEVVFGDTALETTFVDAEHLDAKIPKAQLPTSKSVPITVRTPGPGGGTTTKIAFVISNPGSTITSIDPPSVLLNAPDFQLKVKGTGFVDGSKIVFNGAVLATTRAGDELTATVKTSDVSAAGAKTVSVENPPPGGGLSAAVELVVNNPAPTTTAVDKTVVAAGTATPFPVVITGTGFVSTSKVMAKIGTAAPVALTTQVTNATSIKGTFQAPQMAKASAVLLTVKTDAPGGGESAPALSFSIQPGAPKVTALDPASIPIASNDTTVTIKGTGFLPNSTVTVAGQARAVTGTPTATSLTIVVPATQLTALGTLPVIVTNPGDPSLGGGGGASPPVNLTVGCDQSNVNVILSDTATTTTLETSFGAAPALTRWANESTCPGVLASPVVTKQPARYAVVVNTNPGPVTLSAWADCPDGKGAAYLTFYRRATPPPTDSERLQCTGVVAKGEPHLSPDANGSPSCPGLTKANGGGIMLNTCEKAVVHIQTFDNTSPTLTAPPSLKVKADP